MRLPIILTNLDYFLKGPQTTIFEHRLFALTAQTQALLTEYLQEMLPPQMFEFCFKVSKNAHTSLQHLKTPLSVTLLVVCLTLQPVEAGIVGYSIASETGNDTPLSYHDDSSTTDCDQY